MRTTVTLEEDVERLLRETMHRTRQSFKETLNRALRAGLTGHAPVGKRPRFKIESRPMGLRTGVDPTALNKLVDELEIDAVLNPSRGVATDAEERDHPGR
jgi:hypothetical protein